MLASTRPSDLGIDSADRLAELTIAGRIDGSIPETPMIRRYAWAMMGAQEFGDGELPQWPSATATRSSLQTDSGEREPAQWPSLMIESWQLDEFLAGPVSGEREPAVVAEWPPAAPFQPHPGERESAVVLEWPPAAELRPDSGEREPAVVTEWPPAQRNSGYRNKRRRGLVALTASVFNPLRQLDL